MREYEQVRSLGRRENLLQKVEWRSIHVFLLTFTNTTSKFSLPTAIVTRL